ncbi:hypothetical protein ABHN11_13400 [Brevibacillus centrosporus]|uniref:hypothetical protein n=1 Tax=Brevibacillus centrosporus TaxID=54910 RepID=UPI003985B2FC
MSYIEWTISEPTTDFICSAARGTDQLNNLGKYPNRLDIELIKTTNTGRGVSAGEMADLRLLNWALYN